MKLKHITFTGIDSRTDLSALRKLQMQYPIAEFGVLISKDWRENGNRYFNPSYLASLNKGLNLSAHLCGSIARAAVRGNTGPLFDWFKGNTCAAHFNRCQINIAAYLDNPSRFEYKFCVPFLFWEVILQQKSIDCCQLWLNSMASEHVSVLFDASGGQGIGADIRIMPNVRKAGYAGGISPANVAEKLTYLMNNPNVGDFWIDMESGVRTDDWFDVSKVREVLEICQPIIDRCD